MLRVGDEGLDSHFRVISRSVLPAAEADPQDIFCIYGNHRYIIAVHILHAGGAEPQSLSGVHIVEFDLVICAFRDAGNRQMDKAGLIGSDDVIQTLIAALLQQHGKFAVGDIDGRIDGSGRRVQLCHKVLRLLGIAAKHHLRIAVCAFAGQFELNNTLFIGIVTPAAIHHIDVRVFDEKNDTVAVEDIAVKLLTSLYIHRKLANGSLDLLRITLVTLRVGQGIQVFHLFYQSLRVVFLRKVVECAFKYAFFQDAAGFNQTDHTVAVNDHSTGIGLDLHGSIPCRVDLRHRECQAIIRLELGNIFLGFSLVGVHGDDFQFVLVQVIGLLQKREFHFARTAAGIPEVQNNCFLGLQDLRNGVNIAVGIRNSKIGDHIAQAVDTIGGIALSDHRGSQHNVQLGARNLVFLLHIIAQRYILQNENVIIATRGSKDNNAILGHGTVFYDIVALGRIEDTVIYLIA